MVRGIYRIADSIVEICSMHNEVHELCADYSETGIPEYTIETQQTDIDFERVKSAKENILEGLPIQFFSDPYLETLAVYRKLVLVLLSKGILLFHGSVIAVDGVGYLFTAKSGTGKSTHTRLWREKFGSRAIMVNDDKPLIKISMDKAIVYGTPWDGKHRLSTNIAVPLRAICILERGEKNHIEKVSMKEALPMLFQQAYRPQTEQEMRLTMQLIGMLGRAVDLYRLRCNMEPEAAAVAYEGMQ